MNASVRLLAPLLAVAAFACVEVAAAGGTLATSAEVETVEASLQTGGITADPERQILVTFVEPDFSRGQVGPRGTGYRERGTYRMSRWVRRLARDVAEAHGIRSVAAWPVTVLKVACVVYEIEPGRSREQVLAELARDARVQLAQPMQQFRTLAHAYNDPYSALQNEALGIDLADLHADATGQGITIAVIDTGIDLQHPDLAGQFVGDRNLAESFSNSFSADAHGTAVAGIIAAKADNSIGIVGIAPGARLLALKACWPDRQGELAAQCNSFTVALALNAAVESGAQIVNMSISGPADPILQALVAAAVRRGTILVAARDADASRPFPASIAGVIAVCETGACTGTSTNLLQAPGQRILTTVPGSSYEFLSGSSFSAAHVSGLIALVLQTNARADVAEVMQVLRPFRARSQPIENGAAFSLRDALPGGAQAL